jgi:hypothetical protein
MSDRFQFFEVLLKQRGRRVMVTMHDARLSAVTKRDHIITRPGCDHLARLS